VPAAAVANGSKSIAMGSQTPQAFLDLLLEIETETGASSTSRSTRSGFITSSRRSVQHAGDAQRSTSGRPAGTHRSPLCTTTCSVQNYVTVTRAGGGNATYIGDISRGTYKDGPTVSVSTDGVLLTLASWRVHLGSPRGRLRHPALGVNFANLQAAALGPIFGATRGVGIRVQVINPASAGAAGRGHSHLGLHQEAGYKAWSVSLLDPVRGVEGVHPRDSVQGGWTPPGSQLTGGPYSAGAVSLTVANEPSVLCGLPPRTSRPVSNGRRHCRPHVVVTGITGAASPQTFAVTPRPRQRTIDGRPGEAVAAGGTGAMREDLR